MPNRSLAALVTALTLCNASMPAHAQSRGFICIPDAAAGLTYNESTRRWDSSRFRPPERLIIREVTREDIRDIEALAAQHRTPVSSYEVFTRAKVWVIEPGSVLPSVACDRPLPAGNSTDLWCQQGNAFFDLNLAQMSFFMSLGGGGSLRMRDSTPMITAGSCSRL